MFSVQLTGASCRRVGTGLPGFLRILGCPVGFVKIQRLGSVGSKPQYTSFTSIAARGGGGSFKSEKIYESKEHVPIESFVTILID